MSEKKSPSTDLYLKAKDGFKFDLFKRSKLFTKFYSNVINNFVKRIQKLLNFFVLNLSHDKLIFQAIQSILLKNGGANKTDIIDNFSGKFSKDDANVSVIPITQNFNTSIKLSHCAKDCK